MKHVMLFVFFTTVILGCQQVSIDEIDVLVDAKVKQHFAELQIDQNINQQIQDLNLEEWQTGVDQRFQENISQQINEALPNLKGEQGIPGPQGKQGPRGKQGLQGEKGEPGHFDTSMVIPSLKVNSLQLIDPRNKNIRGELLVVENGATVLRLLDEEGGLGIGLITDEKPDGARALTISDKNQEPIISLTQPGEDTNLEPWLRIEGENNNFTALPRGIFMSKDDYPLFQVAIEEGTKNPQMIFFHPTEGQGSIIFENGDAEKVIVLGLLPSGPQAGEPTLFLNTHGLDVKPGNSSIALAFLEDGSPFILLTDGDPILGGNSNVITSDSDE